MKQRNIIYTSKCHIRVIFASKYHFIILRTKILKNMSNWKWSPTVHDLEKLSVRQSNKIYLSKHCTIFTWLLINFCLFLIQNSFNPAIPPLPLNSIMTRFKFNWLLTTELVIMTPDQLVHGQYDAATPWEHVNESINQSTHYNYITIFYLWYKSQCIKYCFQ